MAESANDGSSWAWQRRIKLRDLLEAIGPDAYYRGQLPPPIPVEMLQRRD